MLLQRLHQPRATQLDRTPGLSRDVPCPSKRSKAARDYSDEPPLNWTSHSHGIQLEGSARGRLANLQSLSLVDETKIPGPAVPVWRDQLESLLSPVGVPVFERMRLLERDDRQVSPPTPFSVMILSEFVTNFFKRLEATATRVGSVAENQAKRVSPASHILEKTCRFRRSLSEQTSLQVCDMIQQIQRIAADRLTAKGTCTKKICTTKGIAC